MSISNLINHSPTQSPSPPPPANDPNYALAAGSQPSNQYESHNRTVNNTTEPEGERILAYKYANLANSVEARVDALLETRRRSVENRLHIITGKPATFTHAVTLRDIGISAHGEEYNLMLQFAQSRKQQFPALFNVMTTHSTCSAQIYGKRIGKGIIQELGRYDGK